MVETVAIIHVCIQAAAVLLWCVRGFWRFYPAWTCFGLLATVQSWAMLETNGQANAGVWCLFAPFLILGMFDTVLELFLRLSRLYKRFHRDRWRWLAIPILLGCVLGGLLVREQLSRPSDFYRGLFLAQIVSGSIFGSVLLLSWIASIPVRIPLNLRHHMLLLTIFIATNTVAFTQYLASEDQLFIRQILLFVPPMVLMAWSLTMRQDGELEQEREEEMPASTLEQVLQALEKIK